MLGCSDAEAMHLELLDSVTTGIHPTGGVEMITSALSTHGVADSPSKSYVLDGSGKRVAVLFVSCHVNPNFVGESVSKSACVASALGPELGSTVLEPIAHGIHLGLTYAIWPLCSELSSVRGINRLQRLWLGPRAFRWLRRATEHTQGTTGTSESDLEFAQALECVAKESLLSEEIRHAARAGLHALESSSWKPRMVLEHGDLWLGNFLLPPKCADKPNGYGFVIIDWRGAKLQGFPIYDLMRLWKSTGWGRRFLIRELDRHVEILSCHRNDSMHYLLSGLGDIRRNLDHFPMERYVAMCENLYSSLKGILRIPRK